MMHYIKKIMFTLIVNKVSICEMNFLRKIALDFLYLFAIYSRLCLLS